MNAKTATTQTGKWLSESTFLSGFVAGQKEGVSPPSAFDVHEVVRDEGYQRELRDDIALARELSKEYRRVGIGGTASYDELRASRRAPRS